jgi:hypothetical protein
VEWAWEFHTEGALLALDQLEPNVGQTLKTLIAQIKKELRYDDSILRYVEHLVRDLAIEPGLRLDDASIKILESTREEVIPLVDGAPPLTDHQKNIISLAGYGIDLEGIFKQVRESPSHVLRESVYPRCDGEKLFVRKATLQALGITSSDVKGQWFSPITDLVKKIDCVGGVVQALHANIGVPRDNGRAYYFEDGAALFLTNPDLFLRNPQWTTFAITVDGLQAEITEGGTKHKCTIVEDGFGGSPPVLDAVPTQSAVGQGGKTCTRTCVCLVVVFAVVFVLIFALVVFLLWLRCARVPEESDESDSESSDSESESSKSDSQSESSESDSESEEEEDDALIFQSTSRHD